MYVYKHQRYSRYDNLDVPNFLKSGSQCPMWNHHYTNRLNNRVYSLNKISVYSQTSLDRRNSSDGYGIWFSTNCGYINTLIPLAYYTEVKVNLHKPDTSERLFDSLDAGNYSTDRRLTGYNMYNENALYLIINETNNIRDMNTPDIYRELKSKANFNNQFTTLTNISARTRCTVHNVNDNIYVMNVYRLTEVEQLYNYIAVVSNDYISKQEDSPWKRMSINLINKLYKYEDIAPNFQELSDYLEPIDAEKRYSVERRENLKNLHSAVVNVYKNKHQTVVNTINDLERKLREQYTLHEETLILLNAAENKAENNALSKFYEDERVKYLKVENDNLYLDLYCPLSVYNSRIAERQIQNENSNINRYEVGDIFKAIFVDEEYELYTYTSMVVSLSGSREVSRQNHCVLPDRIDHPHIAGFNCFGEYRAPIHKAVSTLSLDVLLLTCITAAGNLNFADGTVIANFARALHTRIINNSALKCVRDINTGEWLTLTELATKLNSEEDL